MACALSISVLCAVCACALGVLAALAHLAPPKALTAWDVRMRADARGTLHATVAFAADVHHVCGARGAGVADAAAWLAFARDVLAREAQLVVVLGDFMKPESARVDTADLATCWRAMLAPLADARVPVLVALGNHEREYGVAVQRAAVLDVLYAMGAPPSWDARDAAQPMCARFVDAYGVRVLAAPAVWALDTGLHGLSVEHAERAAAEMARARAASDLVALHIPPPLYMHALYDAAGALLPTGPLDGEAGERVSCWTSDDTDAAQAALVRRAATNAPLLLVAAHDHLNDWVGWWPAGAPYVRAAYARKTGLKSYGASAARDGALAVRIECNVSRARGECTVDMAHVLRAGDGRTEALVQPGMARVSAEWGRQTSCTRPAAPPSGISARMYVLIVFLAVLLMGLAMMFLFRTSRAEGAQHAAAELLASAH